MLRVYFFNTALPCGRCFKIKATGGFVMQDTKQYWQNRNFRANIAKQHTKEMAEKYNDEIEHSIKNTTEYNEFHIFSTPSEKFPATVIEIKNADSVSAIISESVNEKLAVLNFASYKEPGGKFMAGSSAQEESLCHKSFLYNVLSQFKKYYANNCKAKNKALYKNRALYSKDIIFVTDGQQRRCDVITCAAPNITAGRKYCNVSNALNIKELTSRCDFVLAVLAEQDAETIILGAYGCGVFGQSPEDVANIFKNLLTTKYLNVFKKVVFAIPDDTNGNYNTFRKIFA